MYKNVHGSSREQVGQLPLHPTQRSHKQCSHRGHSTSMRDARANKIGKEHSTPSVHAQGWRPQNLAVISETSEGAESAYPHGSRGR